ncbi:OmpH family outer membrane protein [Acetonema longum]|uniref:Outer membrane chaperone Skp (OmpH) n=1 Tax=Acetonema longum DSM 6540 TaxID=1009370 RepID=F7NM19_9FIRM|nr:OmpH family outer membrane protein [Acetonema longum]EGO62945.1 outer membrane chaperone Skp (OmpH) [Acetonema longum DSM 6540]
MHNHVKRLSAIIIVMTFILVLAAGCSGASQVGVFDPEKVMAESPKVKQLQEQLNVKAKELTDKLEQEKANLSAEDQQKRQEEAYNEFLKIKQDLESQVDAALKQASDQVAQEKNLGVILYRSSVAQGGLDVTDDIIKKMQ